MKSLLDHAAPILNGAYGWLRAVEGCLLAFIAGLVIGADERRWAMI